MSDPLDQKIWAKGWRPGDARSVLRPAVADRAFSCGNAAGRQVHRQDGERAVAEGSRGRLGEAEA